MAVALPSTHHSHLDPSDLRLRLTSRSSYGRKYRSTANPTYNPIEKSRDHITRSGSCFQRDLSVEDTIEALIKRGQLRKFIAHKDRRQQTPPEVEERKDREEHAGTINTIFGGLAAGGSSGKSRKAYSREVCITSQNPSKKQKTAPVPTISFSDEDLKDVKTPHDDPLVVTIKAGNFEAVVSTYHLKMKFPMENGIAEVKGDQTTSRQCYVTSYQSKNKEALIIEDLREDTKMQMGEPVENLVSIEVYPGDEDKIVRIGSNLKEDTKLQLVNLLRTYANVFAWTAADMPGIDPELVISEVTDPWNLYVDGSSAVGSSGAGIILISPEGFTIEYTLCFGFQASNNEAEYEALLAGIRLAHALRVDSLSVHSDSQLVVNHILGDYEARDQRMAQYLELVKTSAMKFKNFTIHQIPRDQNTQADALSRLASAEATDVRRFVYLGFLKDRCISSQTEIGVIDQEPCWMDTIINFLSTGELPSERHEARNLRVRAAQYALVEGFYTRNPLAFLISDAYARQNPYMHYKK
ncbi:hypothetical protein RJ639_045236 [Escallonia herrerae]|uniref:RNase H type-1 domain-containing protein n=1 Tax=Escallonia herrerae TaxID=1293975 RepID=A0AA88W848_9ASTE|nr:hypothetical protein RJ639_045236 [Escallonia herrerae]